MRTCRWIIRDPRGDDPTLTSVSASHVRSLDRGVCQRPSSVIYEFRIVDRDTGELTQQAAHKNVFATRQSAYVLPVISLEVNR